MRRTATRDEYIRDVWEIIQKNKQHISQSEFADLLGIDKGNLSRILHPKSKTVLQLHLCDKTL